MPAFGFAAAEALVRRFRAQYVSRRVARAAMRQAVDQVGAMVELRGASLVGFESAFSEEEKLPDRDEAANVEREGQVVRRSLRGDGLARHQEGVDGANVFVRHLCEV